jgi:4-diphosphocytidyl-2-C-methyl-D-erythritol kinase
MRRNRRSYGFVIGDSGPNCKLTRSSGTGQVGFTGDSKGNAMAAWTRAFLLKARAKLNLTLTLGSVQANGLHEIRSFVASLTLADDVWFEPQDGSFTVVCRGIDVPERENLAFRAGEALAEALGADTRGVQIRIEKSIPAQAGLGGGSADAAAALVGLTRIASERGAGPVAQADLFRIAATLGSDVPACLIPGFKRISGTGEIVQPDEVPRPRWGVALLKPEASLSTAIAYRLFDERELELERPSNPLAARDRVEHISASIRSGSYAAFCGLLHNDFDPPVRRALPDVARAHDRLRTAGADATVLCGSGTTVAGFFPTVADAEVSISRIGLGPGEWSAATGFADGE